MLLQVSMAPAIIAQITKDLSKIGVRTGTLFAVISVAALIGSPIGGALILKDRGSYKGLQIFCGCVQSAAVAVFIAARSAQVGLKLKVKI